MAVDDGRVVSNFINQAIRNEPITIYGDGAQTRSFCYVSDLITGIYKIAILDKPLDTPINLGNPAEYSIKTLAELIINLSESNSSLVNKALPQDDPKQRRPDVTLAEKLIEWSPNVSLSQGLKTTIDYFISIK